MSILKKRYSRKKQNDPMNIPIRAVIFDFNGTLFYDTDFHDQAWKELARRYGKELSGDAMDCHVHGVTNKEILKFLFKDDITDEKSDALSAEKEEIYRSICRKKPERCVLTPGANQFLEMLKEKNIPRAIATASIYDNVKFYLSTFQLDRWFDESRIAYDTGAYRGKPWPDLFLAAGEKLGITLSQCMIIEDSPGGLEAAKRAGAGKIIVYMPRKDPSRFYNLGYFDQVIDDFGQISDFDTYHPEDH